MKGELPSAGRILLRGEAGHWRSSGRLGFLLGFLAGHEKLDESRGCFRYQEGGREIFNLELYLRKSLCGWH